MSPPVNQSRANNARNSAIKAEAEQPPRPKGGRQKVAGAGKIVNTLLPGFSRQLAAMLSAGMPIVGTLEALQEQTDNPNFKPVIAGIKANIENGAAFSDALRKYPTIFDDLYCNMVHGGEMGGQLPETIARLAGFLESSAKLRRKVKSAMMYPIIVLCIAIIIALGLITFVVPVFGEMFADFGADLPGPTQFLLNMSGFMKSYGIFVILGMVAVVFVFKRWAKTENGAFAVDRFFLRAPVFGELKKRVAAARFARTFGQLIRSGVPILQSLQIVSGATGSVVAGKVILKAANAVENGEPLSSSMINQDVFPIMLVRMLQAGEKTGKIDEMMENIADFYDDEVETMLSGLTSLMEPLLMVFLGVIIGGIVLSMFLPIFKMGEIVGGG
jgi:type IV pilus assembly protein PilC